MTRATKRISWMVAGAAAALLLAPAPVVAGRPRVYDVDFLVQELLYARDDDDREDAAEDLGRIGDARALPALRHAALYDEEDDVRDEARDAIRRLSRPVVAVAPATRVTVVQPAPTVYVPPRPVVVATRRVYIAPPPEVVHRAVVAHPPIVHRSLVVR